MRYWFALLLLCGCASTKSKDAQFYNRACTPTPVTIEDLAQFNVTPAPGKVMVLRVLRSACPTCKEDLQQIGLMFKTGKWTAEKIQLVLMSYKKEGVETKQTFDAFVRGELLPLGFPLEAAQIVFLDNTYPNLLKSKAKSGERVFPDWKAVPYSLVFGRDGRLAYRGHFTLIASQQDRHYDFVTELQNEACYRNQL